MVNDRFGTLTNREETTVGGETCFTRNKPFDKPMMDVGIIICNHRAKFVEAEFFAVVSEYFFENPAQLKEKHPELYQVLSDTFSQDPAKK